MNAKTRGLLVDTVKQCPPWSQVPAHKQLLRHCITSGIPESHSAANGFEVQIDLVVLISYILSFCP